nr:hypothetical protein [uncultured Allomuricauda sp.]
MRYFIVFYRGMYPEKGPSLAKDLNLESLYIYDDKLLRQETYPNKREFITYISETFGLKWVHITDIKEVSKEDAESYYDKY